MCCSWSDQNLIPQSDFCSHFINSFQLVCSKSVYTLFYGPSTGPYNISRNREGSKFWINVHIGDNLMKNNPSFIFGVKLFKLTFYFISCVYLVSWNWRGKTIFKGAYTGLVSFYYNHGMQWRVFIYRNHFKIYIITNILFNYASVIYRVILIFRSWQKFIIITCFMLVEWLKFHFIINYIFYLNSVSFIFRIRITTESDCFTWNFTTYIAILLVVKLLTRLTIS